MSEEATSVTGSKPQTNSGDVISITKAARKFVHDANDSVDYIHAVDKAVAEAMSAVNLKLENVGKDGR